MKTALLALALLAATSLSLADPAKKPATAPKFCTNTGSGAVCTAAAAPVCTPPLELLCTYEGCFCATIGTAPQACQATIVYPASAPSQAEIAPLPAGCDAASAEIALAAALTKLLQRP
jgi:hypothetical protein